MSSPGPVGPRADRQTVAVTTTLLRGGRVYSPIDPFATALVLDDAMVAWLGSDSAAETQIDSMDTVVDLGGALVTPAFVDAHVHVTATGLALDGLDLTGSTSLLDALDRLARHCQRTSDSVVLGHGWDETRWPERRSPTRAEVDRAAAGRPVYLSRVDVHSALVSSALLTAVPEARLAEGFADEGPVRTEAHHLLRRAALDRVSPEQRRAAARATRQRCGELGIALVHEMAGPEVSSEQDLVDLLELSRTEAGPLVVGYWGELAGVERARTVGAIGVGGDLFVDGAIGSRTAWLRAPYSDGAAQASTSGRRYLTEAQVAEHVVACATGGLQAAFHAIGDAALDIVVAGFVQAAERVGSASLRAGRHRVEHAEMLDAASIAVFAQLGIYASVQPVFDALWGGAHGMYATRLGPARAQTLNPLADLAAAGVPLVLGSDSPVTPLGPWEAIRAASSHCTPSQSISSRAAFAAHTRGGWRAIGQDDAGFLAPGAEAHLAVWDTGELRVTAPDGRLSAWSTDPRSGVPGLPDLSAGTPAPTCLRTYVGGRMVHDTEGALR